MGKPISSDLRERIVRGVEAGQSRRAMAVRFEVAASTAVRIQARYTATGSVAPAGPSQRLWQTWSLPRGHYRQGEGHA